MNNAVKDVMTIRVVSVKRGTSFKEMATALRENRVSAFPVIDDDGKVIGVVSEADMLARKVLSTGMHRGEQDKAEDLTAGNLMTHPAITVSPEDSVLQIKRLPVIDPSGRLAGIISRADVLATFDRSDEQIRREVTDDVIWHEFGVGRASSR
jgi:CBS-domain-containing membrane protein